MQTQFAVFVAGVALDKVPDSPDLRCGACDSRCAKRARGWVVGSTNSPQPLSLNELVLISVICEFGVTEPLSISAPPSFAWATCEHLRPVLLRGVGLYDDPFSDSAMR